VVVAVDPLEAVVVEIDLIQTRHPWPKWGLGVKSMPDDYINAKGNDITPVCIDYLKPLVDKMPRHVRLNAVKA
jgi:hypothetical protein